MRRLEVAKLLRCRIALAAAIAVTAMISLAGCTVHRLREAQDAFSAGAQIENDRTLRPVSFANVDGIPAAPQAAPEDYYATAYGLASEALRTSEGDLRSDHLWGTAKTLCALSAWRLGDTDSATQHAADVVAAAGANDGGDTSVWPRDLAMCRALPALAQVDALTGRMLTLQGDATSSQLDALIFRPSQGMKASDIAAAFDRAAGDLPAGHPLRVYLAFSKAQLARVLHKSLSRAPASQRTPEMTAAYASLRSNVLAELGALATNPAYLDQRAAITELRRRYEELLTDV